MGLKCPKRGLIPAQADAAAQRPVLDKQLWPRRRQARRLRRGVGFVDAAPFVHGPFLGSLGCFVRRLSRGPSGRNRSHVLGAITAVTYELTTVCTDPVINAAAAGELRPALAARDVGRPLTVVLDNARSQRSAPVPQWAKELRIEWLFWPAYWPNLNRSARLWKFVKKQGLSCRSSEDFARFKAAMGYNQKSWTGG